MNKIYKVIWNKTRGMYMVVSELAKGQSKDGRRAVGRKKVAQTAAALALFFSIVSMGGTSFAADTTKVDSSTSGTAVEVYTKDGTDSKAAELNTRITNVKEYLEQQTSDKYVSKADAAGWGHRKSRQDHRRKRDQPGRRPGQRNCRPHRG